VGKIILLNTPIGNLGDLTPRVREALEAGSTFAVEDTRVFKDLLSLLGISLQGKRILSIHDQSAPQEIDKLLELAESHDLYVASEAGSPIISDPAYPLVKAALEKGLRIESCSGVSSPIMALELSGLPPLPFHFHGFLPRESAKKKKAFLAAGYGTHIFFEAPTRIEETLDDLSVTLPNVLVCVVRELSKKFEQTLRFRSSTWPEHKQDLMTKGEFILMFHQSDADKSMSSSLVKLSEEILKEGATPKALSKLLSEILDRPTKEIYIELEQQKRR
jgi:16S rRNA (cytidine1402-2'-O)-methyltransferase